MPSDDSAKSSDSALCEAFHRYDLLLKSMVCFGQSDKSQAHSKSESVSSFAYGNGLLPIGNEFVLVLDAKGIAMKWSLIVMSLCVVGVIAVLQGCAHSGGYPGGCRNGRCSVAPASPAAVPTYQGLEGGTPVYAPPAGSGTR